MLLAVAGCAVATIVAFILWPGAKEPEYKGKKLSEWLEMDGKLISGEYVPGRGKDIVPLEAVKEIGTNALPWLLRWVRYEEPAWRTKLRVGVSKLPPALRWHYLQRRLGPAQPGSPGRMARSGFAILGTQASPAIPELRRLMRSTNVGVSLQATLCLSYIEGDAGQAFREAFDEAALALRRRVTNKITVVEDPIPPR